MPTVKTAHALTRRITLDAEGDFKAYEVAKAEAVHQAGPDRAFVKVLTRRVRVLARGGLSANRFMRPVTMDTKLRRIFIFR